MTINATLPERPSLEESVLLLGTRARQAGEILAQTSDKRKTQALTTIARLIRENQEEILRQNQEDVKNSQGLSASLLDRLHLTPTRVEAMAVSLEEIAALADPIGRRLAAWERPNGLFIERVSVPLGVIGMIYESRPNVTVDAAGLCIKSGNAVILRCGSESFLSSQCLAEVCRRGLEESGLPRDTVQLIPTSDRDAVSIMLRMTDSIDFLIPRGGRALIERVSQESRIPLLKHLDGLCHVYVDEFADQDKAVTVTLNSKLRRTSVCGAAETLLVHRGVIESHLPLLVTTLLDQGCSLCGDSVVQRVDPRVEEASPEDWDREYLGPRMSVRVVDGVDEALAHIARHGSRHTDTILTEDRTVAEYFLRRVDSAIVLWNASTQFADGGEFGMGAEIGISTGKLHARGPVGVEQLTAYKYVVRGNGHVRP